MIMIVVIVIER